MSAVSTLLSQLSLVAFATGLMVLLQPSSLYTTTAADQASVSGNATLSCGLMQCMVVRTGRRTLVDSVAVAGDGCDRRGDWMMGARVICALLSTVLLPCSYAAHLLIACFPLPQEGWRAKVATFARGRAKYVHVAAAVASLLVGGCMLMLYRSDFCDKSLQRQGLYDTSPGFGVPASFALTVLEVFAFLGTVAEDRRCPTPSPTHTAQRGPSVSRRKPPAPAQPAPASSSAAAQADAPCSPPEGGADFVPTSGARPLRSALRQSSSQLGSASERQWEEGSPLIEP
eukprot:TRINITY_DN27249_c0_g1_i1.p2 TRINITY_DN27249_c0_g1~~TRINITY_DN27249_c0_g1_i1.p2  ORF type:complete len:285 (+),score=38.69 TRINITY_DN27249_c0_g1_i1:71-925(+)